MEYRDSEAGVENDFQRHCIGKLAEQYRSDPRLQEIDDHKLLLIAQVTIEAAWPDIVYIGEDDEGFHILSITPSLTTNILGCAMCADRNTLWHLAENGTAQTGTLVNGICGAAISRLTGGWMWQIKPFVLANPLSIGDSAIIKMTTPKPSSVATRIQMQGFIASSMKELFRPTMVYLTKPSSS